MENKMLRIMAHGIKDNFTIELWIKTQKHKSKLISGSMILEHYKMTS
jgi:hypothetical protein